MRVLGIDTATWTASVGICVDGKTRSERSVATGGGHALSLMALVAETLRDAALEMVDIQGVAVSIGPGSFTGLRVGLATAKGLAMAGGLPVAGVSTLEALAAAAEIRDGLVCPVLDARKGEIYAALIEMRGGEARVVQPEVAVALDRWLPVVGDRACTFVGDAVELVRSGARPDWTLLPFERCHPRGAVVARLGWLRLLGGGADDLAGLEPRYVRPSEAEIRFGA